MQCPVCDVELGRIAYERHPVYQCPECRGYLVAKQRVSLIKGSRDRPAEALAQEAADEHQPDSAAVLDCPKCRARRMTKQKMPIRASAGRSFSVDACRHCRVVWFDGGELARLQLDYEQRPKAQDELAAQMRSQDQTAQERQRFEQVLASLPVSTQPSALPVGDIWRIVAVAAPMALAMFFGLLGFPVWTTILASVAVGAAVGWLILERVGITGRNIAVVAVVIVALEALWIWLLLGVGSS